eukprot:Selendium_serpulae@DN496_c0_g1_i1.p1
MSPPGTPTYIVVLMDPADPPADLDWASYQQKSEQTLNVKFIVGNSVAHISHAAVELGTTIEAPTGIIVIQKGDTQILPELMSRATSVRWVHSWFTGIDRLAPLNTFRKSAPQRSLVVTNGKGAFSSSLAEWALAAVLHFAKRIPQAMSQQKEQMWKPFSPQSLRHQTMGLVGFGDIGQCTARLAKAFGMRVIALTRRGAERPGGDSNGLADELFRAEGDQRFELFRKADYVVCSLPSTEQTRHFVSHRELKAMRRSAVLVNVGRGQTVDQTALVAALRAGAIGGAALDVYEEVPVPEGDALWDSANLLMSPYCADNTPGYNDGALRVMADNLAAHLKGEGRYATEVDMDAGY